MRRAGSDSGSHVEAGVARFGRALGAAALVSLAAVVVLALGVSVVQAAPKGVAGFFGNPVGLSEAPLGGQFFTLHGVAVNSNPASPNFGDVYVVDQGNQRVQRFSSLGVFELAWGKDVIKTSPVVDTDLGSGYEVCTHALDCKQGVIGALGGEFTSPRGVAVDQATGDVYVVERGSPGARVQAFDGDGVFKWAQGKDVVVDGSASDPTSVTTAQVCTVASDCKAAAVGGLGGEFGAGGSEVGNGIAVSPVVNPLTGAGNLLVTDRGNRRVQELTSTGGFVRAFGWDTITDASPSDPGSVTGFQVCEVAQDCKGAVTGAGVGQFGGAGVSSNGPNRVAVDSTGAIYTVENGANFRVQKFTPQVGPPSLSPTVVDPNIGGSGPALSLTGTSSSNAPFDVVVGPGDHVFVLKAFPPGVGTPGAEVNERRVVELDPTGALVETHAALAGVGSAIDLAINTDSDELYMSTAFQSVANGFGHGVYVIGDTAAPTVAMGVGVVSTHAAQLNGLVNPGGPDTEIGFRARYHFEYRKIGAPAWTALSADKDAGNGFDPVPVAGNLEDLEADTAYEARLVASKPFSGTQIETTPQAFSTPAAQPDIDSVYVTGRGTTTATLSARINPNGQATSYRFEYGPTAAYGTVVPDPDGNAGTGTSSQIFSETLTDLTPATTYHYRVTATNANGTNTTTDHTFTTRPQAQPPDGRGYELVSPPDKIGGSGVGPWYAGIGAHGNAGIPAYEGERFASLAYFGASLADGAFSYGSDWTLGQRTADGWINRPAFTRSSGQGTPETAKIALIEAASDDLSLTSWDANSQLAIFPEQPSTFGGALPTTPASALREWESGKWEIVAPWAPGQLLGSTRQTQVAADGGYALTYGNFRGVAGPGDPTSAEFVGDPGDLVCSTSTFCPHTNVYIDDVTAGLSDTFPGDGIRSLVNVCTGTGTGTGTGGARTAIPSVGVDGKVAAAECPAALAGRSGRLISSRGASLAASGFLPGHMSDDGSRVFFMSPSHATNSAPCSGTGPVETVCPPQVYVRQRNADGTVVTRWISQSEVAGQDASLMATAVFEGATPDGDKAFFRTASPLTADDPNGGAQVAGGVRTGTVNSSSVDLYMYDFPDAPGADPGDGTLTRISAGPNGDGDANVSASTGSLGGSSPALRAFGDDGARAYFVTAARLAGVPAPTSGTITTASGTVTQTATKNLYAYDANRAAGQQWRLIAQLPTNTTFGECATMGALPARDALLGDNNGVGLDGGVQTQGDANCVRATADGSFITFFTDGRLTVDDPDSVTGDVYGYDAISDELVRMSASRADAIGGSYACVTTGSAAGALCHGDLRITGLGTVRRRPLAVSTDSSGRRTAFFESASRLVAEDVNDVYDVYQWRDGRLSLLSTGAAGAEPALYQGNDRSGRNVFISTRDRLTWQDHDGALDVYTVRLDGGIPEPPAPPGCVLGLDSCQAGGADQLAAPTPSTTTVGGGGDADEGVRRTLSVRTPSARALRRAARSGTLRLAVRAGAAEKVTATARARIGRRSRVVARKSLTAKSGVTTLRLRLNRAARRRVASGKSLGLVVRVSSPGARSRAITVRLPGVQS